MVTRRRRGVWLNCTAATDFSSQDKKQDGVNILLTNPWTTFFKYIKFCRNYGGDKKDDAKENLSSQLSVELEGERGKKTEGNARLYRAGCFFLTLISLVLLMAVIVLSVKLKAGSQDCPRTGDDGTVIWSKVFPKIQAQKSDCHQCGNGWLAFEEMCYYLSTIRMTWSESEKNCTAGGGHLAVISRQNVQTFLTGEANGNFWIGLKHDGNRWSWVGNSALRDSYWEGNPPSRGCGLLRGTGPAQKNWIGSSCTAVSYFICEKQARQHRLSSEK